MIAGRFALLFALAGLTACASAPRVVTAPSEGDVYADFLIGRFANLQQDHQAAAQRYFAALERGNPAPELVDGAIEASLASGDVERARRAARIDERAGANVAAAHLVRAADDLRTRRFEQAARELEALNGDGLEMVAARMLSIWATAGQGRTDAAIAAIDEINAPRPFSDLLAVQRALTLDLAGRPEAAAAYASARAGELRLAPAAVREVDLLARTGHAGDARALFGDARGRIRDPDVERAVSAAEAGGRIASRPLTAAHGAAISLYGLAALLMEQRDQSRALSLLTLTRLLDPDFDLALIALADAQSGLSRPDAARAALAAVPAGSPYAETARAQAAWILRREDRGEEALAEAQRAAHSSGGLMAQLTLGDLYRSLERWSEAEAVYSEIIAGIATPKAEDWIVYFSRAAARERLGRWDEAEADLQAALALSPDQPETLNYLGYAWVDRGMHLQEGLSYIERALALRPNSAQIIDSLGWAHFRLGDYDAAHTHLERAVELEPADVTLNDHLGDALWRMGRRTEARFQWRRALSLDPRPMERESLERKLAEGLPGDEPQAAQR